MVDESLVWCGAGTHRMRLLFSGIELYQIAPEQRVYVAASRASTLPTVRNVPCSRRFDKISAILFQLVYARLQNRTTNVRFDVSVH